MLNQQTIEKLYGMRMRGMADGFRQQQEEPQTMQLSFAERFALLVDRHGTGGRTERWRGGSKKADYKVQPAWRISTIVQCEVWISHWCAP